MDKRLKIINFVLILAVLSSLAYAATEAEFNKDFQEKIIGAPTNDNGLALSDLQYRIVDIAKSKNFKIDPETKYEFYKKHIAVTDTDNVLYLSVVRKDMKLTKDELNKLSPSQQAEVATVVKKAGEGGGFSLGRTAVILSIFLVIAALLWKKYVHKEYMLGRQAKKILRFERHAQSSLHKEELNMRSIGEIEKKKQELIDQNVRLVKDLEKDEHEILRLDSELRNKTQFKDGIHDKGLAKVENITEFLKKDINRMDAIAIEDIVKGKAKPAAKKIEDNIFKIKEQNVRLDRLIGKELALDNNMMEELLRGKEQVDVSKVDLEKVKEFVKRFE